MKLLLLTVAILLSLPVEAKEQKSYKWTTRCHGGGTYVIGGRLVTTSSYACRKVMVNNPKGPESERMKEIRLLKESNDRLEAEHRRKLAIETAAENEL